MVMTQVDMFRWLHGISMDRLPPLQYSLDAPSLPKNCSKIHKTIVTRLDTERTWISPMQELAFLHRPPFSYIDAHVTRPLLVSNDEKMYVSAGITSLRSNISVTWSQRQRNTTHVDAQCTMRSWWHGRINEIITKHRQRPSRYFTS